MAWKAVIVFNFQLEIYEIPQIFVPYRFDTVNDRTLDEF